MTEAEWLEGAHLYGLTDFLGDRVGNYRRLRLFACACCRRSRKSRAVRPAWPMGSLARDPESGLKLNSASEVVHLNFHRFGDSHQ